MKEKECRKTRNKKKKIKEKGKRSYGFAHFFLFFLCRGRWVLLQLGILSWTMRTFKRRGK